MTKQRSGRKKTKPPTGAFYIAIDRWGLFASIPWRKRLLLVGWLQRKYPASCHTYTIARVLVTELRTKRKGKR